MTTAQIYAALADLSVVTSDNPVALDKITELMDAIKHAETAKGLDTSDRKRFTAINGFAKHCAKSMQGNPALAGLSSDRDNPCVVGLCDGFLLWTATKDARYNTLPQAAESTFSFLRLLSSAEDGAMYTIKLPALTDLKLQLAALKKTGAKSATHAVNVGTYGHRVDLSKLIRCMEMFGATQCRINPTKLTAPLYFENGVDDSHGVLMPLRPLPA